MPLTASMWVRSKLGPATIIAFRRKRCGRDLIVDMLGESIRQQVGKPTAEALLPFQLTRMVVGIGIVAIESNIPEYRDKAWPPADLRKAQDAPRCTVAC